MTTLLRRCTWRTCRQQAVWYISAGKPGSGYHAAALACEQHRHHVWTRTTKKAAGTPATHKRLPDQEPPHQEQTVINI